MLIGFSVTVAVVLLVSFDLGSFVVLFGCGSGSSCCELLRRAAGLKWPKPGK